MIVSVPDTDGRYYLLPMLDMWTDVFASPGWRTTGTEAADFPRHAARLDGRAKRSRRCARASTRRRPMSGSSAAPRRMARPDYDAVHKIQAGYKITPLSQWGKDAGAAEVKIDPSHRHEDAAEGPGRYHAGRQIFRLCGGAAEAASAASHRSADPRPVEAARLRARQELRSHKADPAVKQRSTSAPSDAQAADEVEVADARAHRQWLVDEHRHDGRLRQLLSEARHRRPGRPRREPSRGCDLSAQSCRQHRPAARRREQLHDPFRQGRRLPPVDAFWSITLYDQEGFQVANPLNRFACRAGCRSDYNADGSLDLYFQNQSPGADKEANWLPAPTGPFNLTMRLYAPKADALTGKWNPPPVTKAP